MIAQVHNANTGRNRSIMVIGFVKPSGVKVAKVINDEGVTYLVTVKPDGTTTCKHVNGDECDAHRYIKSHRCYHVDAAAFAALPTFESLADQKKVKKVVAPAEPVVPQPVKRSSEDAPLYRATFGIPKSWKELEAEAAAKEEKIA